MNEATGTTNEAVNGVDRREQPQPVPAMSPEQAELINRQLAWSSNIVQSMFQFGVAPVGVEYHHVAQFHQKFGLMVGQAPRHLTKRKLKERIEFMMEELLEFCDASGFAVEISKKFDSDGQFTGSHEVTLDSFVDDQDLAGQADALVDLAYVTYGTAVMMGMPWGPLWIDVQRANMAKVPGVTHRGHAVDVTKPEGWVGPHTQQILAAFGYNRGDYIHQHTGMVNEELCHDDTRA